LIVFLFAAKVPFSPLSQHLPPNVTQIPYGMTYALADGLLLL
jgi:hypothetical protein